MQPNGHTQAKFDVFVHQTEHIGHMCFVCEQNVSLIITFLPYTMECMCVCAWSVSSWAKDRGGQGALCRVTL